MAIKPKQGSRIPVPVSKKNKPTMRTPKKPFQRSAKSPAGSVNKRNNITPRKRKHSGSDKVDDQVASRQELQNEDVQPKIEDHKPSLAQFESNTMNSAKIKGKRASIQIPQDSGPKIDETPKRDGPSKEETTERQPSTVISKEIKTAAADTGSTGNAGGHKVSKRQKRNRKAILKKQVLDGTSRPKAAENTNSENTEDNDTKPAAATESVENPGDDNQVPIAAADASKTDDDPTSAGKKTDPAKGKSKGKGDKFNKDKKKFTKREDRPGRDKQDRGGPRTGFTPQQQQEIDEYRASLEAQGAPKEVISAAIFKKVRSIQRRNKRTAEKRSNKICLSCRKPGHFYKDCPEASNETGCCFKCGSKEHTSRECPNKSENYAFATCYICKERGHIAKHCKQNPHGLYVRGGSCHYCGDIRHFARECPNKNRGDGDSDGVEQQPQILAGTRRDNQASADADLNDEPPAQVAQTERKRGGVVKF